MLLLSYCLALLLMLDRGVVHVVGGYIVYHYYLRLDRREVHVIVVILSTITFQCLTEEWFMLSVVILFTIAV
jgi:hypothetical protein